jgi:hypothetical protein
MVQRFALPLEVGRSMRHVVEGRTLITEVERIEEIAVPAGTYKCLVCATREAGEGKKPVARSWLAPHAGIVQTKAFQRDRETTTVLMAVRKPGGVSAAPGTVVLSDFDSGDPLSSPLFPKGRWTTEKGGVNAFAQIDIDPETAAQDSSMSLRWSFQTKATWVTAQIVPLGSQSEFADISGYDSVSFHVKAFKPGKVGFLVRGRGPGGEDGAYSATQVELTTGWKQVAVDLQAPEWAKLDLTKVNVISFFHWPSDYDANVVWVDQLRFLKKKAAKPVK